MSCVVCSVKCVVCVCVCICVCVDVCVCVVVSVMCVCVCVCTCVFSNQTHKEHSSLVEIAQGDDAGRVRLQRDAHGHVVEEAVAQLHVDDAIRVRLAFEK